MATAAAIARQDRRKAEIAALQTRAAQGPFTIDLPGLQDLIRIPALENVDLRRQRWARYMTRNSALPAALHVGPCVVQALDDFQDFLITALVIAKPLLRKLPARVIPGLGWVLLANDVLNWVTGTVQVALAGRGAKRVIHNGADLVNTGRDRRLKSASSFLLRTSWWSFAIQAGQVAQSLTGYGLSLGAVMGAATDGFWALIRASQGRGIRLRLPPSADPVGAAARVLMQSQVYLQLPPDTLSTEDQALHITALNMAAKEMHGSAAPPSSLRALDLAGNLKDCWEVWNPWTLLALKLEGWRVAAPLGFAAGDTDPITGLTYDEPLTPDNRELQPFASQPEAAYPQLLGPQGSGIGVPFRNHPEVADRNVTYQEAHNRTEETLGRYELESNELWQENSLGQVLGMMYNNAGALLLDYANQQDDSTGPILEPGEEDFLRAVEFNIFPPQAAVDPDRVGTWLQAAGDTSRNRGFTAAAALELKLAALLTFNAWKRRPFAPSQGPFEFPERAPEFDPEARHQLSGR